MFVRFIATLFEAITFHNWLQFCSLCFSDTLWSYLVFENTVHFLSASLVLDFHHFICKLLLAIYWTEGLKMRS